MGRRAPSQTESPHAELQDSDDSNTAHKHTTTNLVMHIGRQPCTYTVTVGGGVGGGGGVRGGRSAVEGRSLLTSSVIRLIYKSCCFFFFPLSSRDKMRIMEVMQVLCGVRADKTSSPIHSLELLELH